jgi:hypothetical protein
MPMMTRIAIVLALCGSLGLPAGLWADNGTNRFSHLNCMKIKDVLPKASYHVSMEDSSLDCIVKVPAKLVCLATYKIGIGPPPPGGGPDVDLNEGVFFCYKQKCRQNFQPNLNGLRDQFGSHNVSGTAVSVSKMLCAPASPSGAFLE